MVIGTDTGIYTVGGGALGIVLTKLVITAGPIGVPQTAPEAPKVSRLSLPAHNPATAFVRLHYDTARDQTVTLEVYDSGRLIKRLVDGRSPRVATQLSGTFAAFQRASTSLGSRRGIPIRPGRS